MYWKHIFAGAILTLTFVVTGDACADRGPPVIRLYHLEPLGKNSLEQYSRLSEFIKTVTPKPDRRLAAIYIDYGRLEEKFLGVFWAQDKKGYYLLYAQQDESAPIVKKTLDVPDAFAEDVINRLGDAIRAGTRYSRDSIPLLGCLGAKDYIFESVGAYGSTIDCATSGPTRQLFQLASDLIELVQLKNPSADQRNAKMDAIRSDLVAAMVPDQADGKGTCQQIRGEYQHWKGYPLSERIEASDGKSYGLMPSLEWASDLQPPLYSLPGSLQQVLDADEDAAGAFMYCLVPQVDGLDTEEKEPVQLGWIKSFTPADSSPQADYIRKLKVVAIRAAYVHPGTIKFRRIDVSFDYMDGVISNAKIEKSDYPSEDDSPALAYIAKASYPPEPDDLKGKKLHIEVPIYLGLTE
jgi:hypothetical protein